MGHAQSCKQCGQTIYFDGICMSCREENERKAILALSQSEIDDCIEKICDEIDTTGELGICEDLCRRLVNYRNISTEKIAETAWEKGFLSYYDLYKDAPAHIVTEMIEQVLDEESDSNMAGALLLCLAVCGDSRVFDTFLELEGFPRPWRRNLYVNASMYATYGGWTYDKDGNFMKTNFDKCYPMVKGSAEEKEKSPVKIGTMTDEHCSICGCQIINLMEIDGRDPRLEFLGIDGTIKMKCCPNCFPYMDAAFCRYIENGESACIPYESAAENFFDEGSIAKFVSNTYILGDTAVSPRYAADWEGGSSIGGFAFWIQDCDIKTCPDCGKPMQYLAQVQWDTILEGMEGNFYIEICKDCKVMAILHQQT